ncbi:mariner Mos1 transposase [Trichonephila clavipes]|nr:mariner Mos1 transposase [Trichonephila clavipes]
MKKSVAEAHRMLSNTYGEAGISERTCREWFQRFKNGDFDVEDQHGIWWDQLGVVNYEFLNQLKQSQISRRPESLSIVNLDSSLTAQKPTRNMFSCPASYKGYCNDGVNLPDA